MKELFQLGTKSRILFGIKINFVFCVVFANINPISRHNPWRSKAKDKILENRKNCPCGSHIASPTDLEASDLTGQSELWGVFNLSSSWIRNSILLSKTYGLLYYDLLHWKKTCFPLKVYRIRYELFSLRFWRFLISLHKYSICNISSL